ncbi:MAG: hypothetical protein Q8R50_09175 [Sediminibacterium sp.]|nr:hypothetical protein [Sediminibacterium sp.]
MKKYFIGLLAVIIAVGVSAFTAKSNSDPSKGLTIVLKHYTMNSVNGSTEFQAGNYDDNTSADCPGSASVPCIIQYDDSQFSSLQAYLDYASTNGLTINSYKF